MTIDLDNGIITMNPYGTPPYHDPTFADLDLSLDTETSEPVSTKAFWACLARPSVRDDVSLAWRPLGWDPKDQNYSIAVSRRGILVGDVYLNEIPDAIMRLVWHALRVLQQGDNDEVAGLMDQVTHVRMKHGTGWRMVPIGEYRARKASYTDE
jgi:hypothetical protein